MSKRISLFWYFIVPTIVLSCIILLYYPFYLKPRFENEIIKQSEQDSEKISGHFIIDYFSNFEGDDAFNYQEMEANLQRDKEIFGLWKLRLFDAGGKIIYSSKKTEIGDLNTRSYFTEIVANGRIFTKNVRKEEKSASGAIVPYDVVETYVPIMRQNTFMGAFELYMDVTEQMRRIETLFWHSYAVSIPIVIFFVLLVFYSSYKITQSAKEREKNIAELQKALTEIQTADKQREKLESQIRQSHKMEALGTLAGGIAHDFNNILTAILGNTELLTTYFPTGSDSMKHLNAISKAGGRAVDLVKQILLFSRMEPELFKPVNITRAVTEALDILRATLPANIIIYSDIRGENFNILGNATQIHQIIINIGTNGFHAMEEQSGQLSVSLEQLEEYPSGVEAASAPCLLLTIDDTGTGISPEDRENIFDPFFTTKVAGKGSGLGLSVVHGIVKRHGGKIVVDSKPGLGSSFKIYLPGADHVEEPGEIKISEPGENGKGHLLIIEDEESIETIYHEFFEKSGYKVTTCKNGQNALETFQENPERYDLVLTDHAMPVMTGKQLSKELLKIKPDLPIILTTGYSNQLTPDEAKTIGIREFLLKPVPLHELDKVIRKCLQ